MYQKYPRTPHLRWSEGVTSDDIFLVDDNVFKGKQVVVTEKLDGENSNFYYDKYHARSIDSKDHPSRHLAKALWAQIKNDIPINLRICSENLYAKHSIYYSHLPSVLLTFAIFNEELCLSWTETEEWCSLLGLKTVPVLYMGLWDEEKIKACYIGKSQFGDTQEGYVVRLADRFKIEDFETSVAKFVRKNHVQTSNHWLQEKIIPNGILK